MEKDWKSTRKSDVDVGGWTCGGGHRVGMFLFHMLGTTGKQPSWIGHLALGQLRLGRLCRQTLKWHDKDIVAEVDVINGPNPWTFTYHG